MLNDSDREQAESIAKAKVGSLIFNRLVPAPDHGAGFRRDPETGFVYYSSEWLSDELRANCLDCKPGEIHTTKSNHAYRVRP